jgi:hypothetical protein
MRFATACKLSGSRVGEIPFSFKRNIKWYEHELKNIKSNNEIFHPVKKSILEPTKMNKNIFLDLGGIIAKA